jgi:hypothetical protein
MNESWLTSPTIFLVAPACPHCRAPRPIIVRSEAGGDGSITRKCVCRRCSAKFKIVLELPNPGNDDGDGSYTFDGGAK